MRGFTAVLGMALATASLAAIAPAQTGGLAATPPMGWNSWNHFAEKVTDKDIRDTADQLVSTGMKDAGYIYVNIDDTWQGTRDAQGNLHPNDKFPDMKALADYVHSKGLKIGIYSSPGPKTCADYAGSYGHEEQDAKQYAAWGIDYLKYDLCSFGEIMKKEAPDDVHKRWAMMHAAYVKMDQALRSTGRPIVFSLCQYGWDSTWRWAPREVHGNLWRTTGDIQDNWLSMSDNGFSQAGLAKFAGPGHWNDPDMLEVGNGGMTTDEYRTHMTLWSILASPLLAGNDLTKMSPADKGILMNRDVIAIDQDPLGKQGDRIAEEGPYETWSKPLSGGRVAIALFNRGEQQTMQLPPASAVGLKSYTTVKNVWSPSETGKGPWLVPSHGVVLLITQ